MYYETSEVPDGKAHMKSIEDMTREEFIEKFSMLDDYSQFEGRIRMVEQILGVKRGTVHRRLYYDKWSWCDAITKPVMTPSQSGRMGARKAPPLFLKGSISQRRRRA